MTDYRLDDLGWYQFERLCQTLLRVTHGARLETWGGLRDLGRDAYASGSLRFPDPKVEHDGPFVFQAKFVEQANAAGARPSRPLLNGIDAECERIEERLSEGIWEEPAVFALMTNVALTPARRRDVRQRLSDALPDSEIVLIGGKELSSMLDDQPKVRAAYPQVLGLRDLEVLIGRATSADVRNRSTFMLSSAERLARVFVPTRAYALANENLNKHGFCVLTGPPEMGKTATARIIALSRFTDGWEAFECRKPDDLFKVYERSNQQVFLADDAFGSTEYRPEIAAEWAADLDRVVELADGNHHVLWTSRPTPLKEGLRQLHIQGSARGFPAPAEVQVDSGRLSVQEKAQILYRHAKAAELGVEATAIVREHASDIVRSPNFTPLRIERFVSEHLPDIVAAHEDSRSDLVERAVDDGLQRPTRAMQTSFEALNEEQRAALFAMLSVSQGQADLDFIHERVEHLLGRPPVLGTPKNVELLDEHFLRLTEGARHDLPF